MDARLRPVRVAAPVAAGLLLLFVAAQTIAVAQGAIHRGELGHDAELYISSARRWIETGAFYYPVQFAGPYVPAGRVMLYPPIALYLFVPFLWLPRILWWLVPLAVFVAVLWHWRPARWSWPVMAAMLVPVGFSAALAYGNSDLWTAAIIALATRWPAAAALLGFKPSVFPVAFLFAWDRRWWQSAAIVAALSLPFLALWPQWVTAIRNLDTAATYSLSSVPWWAVAIVARIASTREPWAFRWPVSRRWSPRTAASPSASSGSTPGR